MTHRRIAALTILAAIILDAVLGLAYSRAESIPAAHGLFCGLANAVTDGCDVAPRTTTAYVVTSMEYLLVVPLFAATFSLMTSGLTAVHVASAERRIKAHVNGALRHHLTPALAAAAAGRPPDQTAPMPAGSAGTSGRKPPQREGGPQR